MQTESEKALVEYLYQRLSEAMQPWRQYDDIYGIWILVDVEPGSIASIGCLRLSNQTPELLRGWGGVHWALDFAHPFLDLRLCDDGIEPGYEDEDEEDFEDTDENENEVPDPQGVVLRDAFWEEFRQQPEYRPLAEKPSYVFTDFVEQQAFVQVVGQAIKRLHENGAVVEVCGKPVPVGITYSHDSDSLMTGFSATITEASNPPGLADELVACQRRVGL